MLGIKRKIKIEAYQITINDVLIEVVRKKIKNLRLTVSPPVGKVRLVAPFRFTQKALNALLIEWMDWIKRQQAKYVGQEPPISHNFVTGEMHLFQGERYCLNVCYQKGAPRIAIRENATLDLYVPEGSTSAQRKKVLLEGYREHLSAHIPAMIARYEPLMRVKVNEWRIRQMKTRWGSCNITDRRIWLSLELAKKPLVCLEYIVVHEMVHLLEQRHNKRFKNFMDRFMPDWRIHNKQLKS